MNDQLIHNKTYAHRLRPTLIKQACHGAPQILSDPFVFVSHHRASRGGLAIHTPVFHTCLARLPACSPTCPTVRPPRVSAWPFTRPHTHRLAWTPPCTRLPWTPACLVRLKGRLRWVADFWTGCIICTCILSFSLSVSPLDWDSHTVTSDN
ncbi:hypothetical protein BC827DRAFT_883472 [Russula dissimulans]|nr:hypothetical protein BC827DRAFT_883472 [Russula dissimulans]